MAERRGLSKTHNQMGERLAQSFPLTIRSGVITWALCLICHTVHVRYWKNLCLWLLSRPLETCQLQTLWFKLVQTGPQSYTWCSSSAVGNLGQGSLAGLLEHKKSSSWELSLGLEHDDRRETLQPQRKANTGPPNNLLTGSRTFACFSSNAVCHGAGFQDCLGMVQNHILSTTSAALKSKNVLMPSFVKW